MVFWGIWAKGSWDLWNILLSRRHRSLTSIGPRALDRGYALFDEDTSHLRVKSIGAFFGELVTFGEPGPRCVKYNETHLPLLSLRGLKEGKYS